MHPPRFIHLAHCCVYDWETGASFAPALEEIVVVFPFHIGVFVFEGFGHAYVRPVDKDVFVEIAPGYF